MQQLYIAKLKQTQRDVYYYVTCATDKGQMEVTLNIITDLINTSLLKAAGLLQ
jgi:hypothetical protein